jgi:hypothetical protein
MDVFRFIPGYTHGVYQDGKEPLLLLLLGFLITFIVTRAYTRIARVRGWGSAHVGGVHMHHVVPGVLLMLGAGLADFAFTADGAFRNVLAILFGAGAALMLDEFAMVFHIEDVYWSPEGRSSVDAVIFVTMITLLLLVSSSSIADDGDRTALVTTILITTALAVITLLKGKLKMSIMSIVVLGIGVIGAWRLAKPGSWWANRFYDPKRDRRAARKHERALARAATRQRRWEARRLRMLDIVGGAPSLELPAETLEPVSTEPHREPRRD